MEGVVLLDKKQVHNEEGKKNLKKVVEVLRE